MGKEVLAAFGRRIIAGEVFTMPMREIHTLKESQHELPQVETIEVTVLGHQPYSHLYHCLGTCSTEEEEYTVNMALPIKKIREDQGSNIFPRSRKVPVRHHTYAY